MTIRFVTTDELIHINERFSSGIRTYVAGKQRVRDLDLLEAAVQRPMQSAFGQDAYPSLEAKASALLHSIIRNHPFADGNKRTGAVGAIFMLHVNGRRVDWQAEQALLRILEVAEGQLEVEDLAAWLHTEPCPAQLIPNAQADVALIDEIVAQQAWLLDQLAMR